jgi:uncharacterized protein (DUF58 family)
MVTEVSTPAVAMAAQTVPLRNWMGRLRQRALRTAPDDRESIVLRHGRIYIVPSRRGLAFLAGVLMMLITSLNYALSLGFAVTFLLSGLAAAALLHTFRNLVGIEVRPLASGETFAGNVLPFTLSVAAGTATRSAVSLTAAGSDATLIDVPAAGMTSVTIEVPTAYRGLLALGRVTLFSNFPLGLWSGWAYVHFPLSGVVYPMPEAGAPPLPSGHGDDNTSTVRRSADGELAGLREYLPGDPMQRVAWKAVARGAGWYTKQFEATGGGGPVELAWAALPPGLDTEARLARLTAWVLAAERAARPFSLTLPGFALPAGQGRAHRRAALTALALYQETRR